MDANTNPIELCGTVAAVIYQNEENGYTVLKLDVDDGSQTMVVGCIPYAVPGESMIVTGNWMTHPAHGQHHSQDQRCRCGRGQPPGWIGQDGPGTGRPPPNDRTSACR